MVDNITLVSVNDVSEEKVMQFRKEFLEVGEKSINGSRGLQNYDQYVDWIWLVTECEKIDNKLLGVQATLYFAVRKSDDRIVGCIELRHTINDELAIIGGHIGYSVIPKERRKGYATKMLEFVLMEARKLGIDKVLLTCDVDNVASQKTIERNRGVLERETPFILGEEQYYKYWIDLDNCKSSVKELFDSWDETLIWSCLQGIMGEIHTNSTQDAAMAILGEFEFFAGRPCEELAKFKPKNCKQDFIIMVPQNDEWAKIIEKCYGDKAKKITRYAIKKEKGNFDVAKLEQAYMNFPEDYQLKMIGEEEFWKCKSNGWSNDLVSQFKDYSVYNQLGLGVVVLRDGEVVAGASSYSRYREGIEIEIDTREDYRRKGLAYACGAKLIVECLKRDLYPSWDAQNKWSVALAEKLGYHFSHEYTAYEVVGY